MFSENSYGYQSGGYFTACDYMKSALDSYLQNLLVISSSEPLTPLQLFSAFDVGNASVGVAIYRSSWSRDDNGTNSVSLGRTCSASLSQIGIKGGVLLPLRSTTMLDLALCLRLNRAASEYSNNNSGAPLTASSFSANGYEVSFFGRMFHELSPKVSLVPIVRVEMFYYEPEVSSTPFSNQLFPLPNTFVKREYELGLGLQSRWGRSTSVLGVSIQYISLKNDAANNGGSKYTRTWFDLPKINAGVEFSITSWLIGRAGYFKRFSTQTTYIEPLSPMPPTETAVSIEPGFLPSFGLTAAEQTLSLGIGIIIDRFAFNGYLAEQMIGTGSYLLSGVQQSLFGVVSLSCHF